MIDDIRHMTINFTPEPSTEQTVICDEPAKVIPIFTEEQPKEQEEVQIDDTVHFNNQYGLHIRDKTGQYVYPLEGAIQSMVLQLLMQLPGN